MDVKKFQVLISGGPDVGGYTAQCVEIPGAISQGATLEEARENIADAIRMILEFRRKEAKKEATRPGFRIVTVLADA
ncbi:MAG: type II toxin-antitoxin system HicB family antitoxin [Thermoplasmatota archaeon]